MNETQEKTVLSLLERQQYASVEELSAALAVSASTTRRILEGLQNRKLITRTHGGETERREQRGAKLHLPHSPEFIRKEKNRPLGD